MLDSFLNLAMDASHESGKSILDFYKKEVNVDYRIDGAPLTFADKVAHTLIINHLASSDILCVSEEVSDLLLGADRYWLTDPLDGKKDFSGKQ
jgi:3'(2'), 5'-bisphosphate nucleotidase